MGDSHDRLHARATSNQAAVAPGCRLASCKDKALSDVIAARSRGEHARREVRSVRGDFGRNEKNVLAKFRKMGTIISKHSFEEVREFGTLGCFEEGRFKLKLWVNHSLPSGRSAPAARGEQIRCLVSAAAHLSSFGPSPTVGKEIARYVS
jgi:hypothetical protein